MAALLTLNSAVMVPMVVVLSPAKTMDMTAVKPGQFLSSEPRMMSQASILKVLYIAFYIHVNSMYNVLETDFSEI